MDLKTLLADAQPATYPLRADPFSWHRLWHNAHGRPVLQFLSIRLFISRGNGLRALIDAVFDRIP